MKLTDRKLTKIFFSSEIRIGPDNPKLETGTSQFVTSWPPSTPNKPDHNTTKRGAGGVFRWSASEREQQPSTTLTGGAVLQTGGGQIQGPSLQQQSTLKVSLGQSFQAGRLFRIPSCQPGTTTSGVTQRQRIKHPNQKVARWTISPSWPTFSVRIDPFFSVKFYEQYSRNNPRITIIISKSCVLFQEQNTNWHVNSTH